MTAKEKFTGAAFEHSPHCGRRNKLSCMPRMQCEPPKTTPVKYRRRLPRNFASRGGRFPRGVNMGTWIPIPWTNCRTPSSRRKRKGDRAVGASVLPPKAASCSERLSEDWGSCGAAGKNCCSTWRPIGRSRRGPGICCAFCCLAIGIETKNRDLMLDRSFFATQAWRCTAKKKKRLRRTDHRVIIEGKKSTTRMGTKRGLLSRGAGFPFTCLDGRASSGRAP